MLNAIITANDQTATQKKSDSRKEIGRDSAHTETDMNGMPLSRKPLRTIPTFAKFILTVKPAVFSATVPTCP